MDNDSLDEKAKPRNKKPSQYTPLLERIMRGETCKVKGVAKSTLQKGLLRAKDAMYAEAAEFGIPMPVKHIHIESSTLDDEPILLVSVKDPDFNFKPKLVILD